MQTPLENWHSGSCIVAVSPSCICNTPGAAAGMLDRGALAFRVFVDSLMSTGCLKQIPWGPRLFKRVRSWSFIETPAKSQRLFRQPKFTRSLQCDLPNSPWPKRHSRVMALSVPCVRVDLRAAILRATYMGLPTVPVTQTLFSCTSMTASCACVKKETGNRKRHRQSRNNTKAWAVATLPASASWFDELRRFYTQPLLRHTNTFTHKRCYTQTLWHTEAFTHKCFETQTLLHTNTFRHKHFYTQTLYHTITFAHNHFYTQ